MAIPAEILAISRPKNTIVVDLGGNGPKRFAVRSRKSVIRLPGKNPAPINGKVIGHIIDGQYIPKVDPIAINGPSFCSYGASAFAYSVSGDILQDLYKVFPISDAQSILSIAIIRVLKPHVAANRYGVFYKQTYLSQYLPNVHLSKNYITSLQEKIGMDGEKRHKFFDLRMKNICESHHIVIDGMLKSNNSTVNDLNSFSYKSKLKGTNDISILYALDLETQELLCAEVFQGNSVDALSYRSFIKNNKICKGVIIADKGFPLSVLKKILHEENFSLHYISPLKRNDKRFIENKMFLYDDRFSWEGNDILCKKRKLEDGTFIYSFRDPNRAAKEEQSYLKKTKDNEQFDIEKYEEHKKRFGTLTVISDLDVDAKYIYDYYSKRWIIETIFDRYKNDIELTTTSVQNNYSVIGSEFINFISVLITTRLLKKASDAGILDHMTFGNLIDDLSQVRRKTCSNIDELPEFNDNFWEQNPIKEHINTMEKLGLIKPIPKPEIKRRGRPPKEKTQKENTEIKRPGRPRKRPKPDPNAPKRPVGRPRIHPKSDPSAPMQPVGRHRKKKSETDTLEA